MNIKYYEKLIIAIVIFLGVVVATAFIIGVYNKRVNTSKNNNPNKGGIILQNINLI